MSVQAAPITITDVEGEIREIEQQLIPFKIPLGLPLLNPFSDKRMHFRKQYRVTGVSVDEAATGVLFGNYRGFMDIKTETYSRSDRSRHLVFNPFTRELEQIAGRYTGEIGELTGRGTAAVMAAGLGLIEWNIREDHGAPAGVVALDFQTNNDLFSGHFKINVKPAADGVILEDDWTPEGGADMRTSFLAMANLVLLTHPKGFEQIAGNLIEEVKRARAAGVRYMGEIGPPLGRRRSRDQLRGFASLNASG